MRTSTLTCLFLVTPVVFVAAFNARAEAATQLELKHMVARVVVVPENRNDIELKVKNNPKLPKLTVSLKGDTMIVSGQLGRKSDTCNPPVNITLGHKEPHKRTLVVEGVGNITYQDLPIVYVKTPLNVRISAQSPIFGEIATSQNLDLSVAQCGHWVVKPVSGNLKLSNAGSADIEVASGGVTDISSAGSGDITLGNLRALTLNSAGSADIMAADISGPVSLSTGGSGDSKINRVNGNVSVSIAGSGDVRIDHGTAPLMNVSIAGSGDVQFGGTAGKVDASIAGSGDVRLARVTGGVNKRVIGSGSVQVGP